MAEGGRTEAASTARRAVTAAAVIGLVAGGVALVGAGLDVVLLTFLGVLLGIFVAAPTDALKRRGVPRGVALTLVLVALSGVVGAFGWFLGDQIVHQVGQLGQELPQRLREVEAWIRGLPAGDRVMESLPDAEQLTEGGESLARDAAGVLSSAAGLVGGLLFILFTGVYLAVEPGVYREGFLRLYRPEKRGRGREVLAAIARTLRWWLLGRAVSMVLVAGIVTGALALMGIPVPIALGAIAGVLDFVPNIGPIVAAVPAVLLAVAEGPEKALWVVALYVGVQLLEGFVITPLVERQTVHIPAALLLAVQLLVGTVFGALALAVATPFLAAALIALRMLYLEDVLGEPPAKAEG